MGIIKRIREAGRSQGVKRTIQGAKDVGREAKSALGMLRAPPVRAGTPSLGFTLMPTDLNPKIVRKKPRKVGKGRVLFTASGKPISVRNAPSVRRLRRRIRRR